MARGIAVALARDWPLAMSAPGGMFSGPFGSPAVSAEDDVVPAGVKLGRRSSVSAESMSNTTELSGCAQFPKTEHQKERLMAALMPNLLFRQLESDQVQSLLLAMREMRFTKGDIVIQQGDDGDFCYVTEQGSLDVFVQPLGTPAEVAVRAGPSELGKKVATYGPGATFGELALLYKQPRAASVVATTDCVLWALDRVSFRSILAHSDVRRRILLNSFMQQVPLLHHLREDERLRVCDAIEFVEYPAGETVLREGDIGTQFFLIMNGVAEVIKQNKTVSLLQRGDYFGELALLHRAPRAATVIASARSPSQELRVGVLQEDAFTRLLGPLSDIMNRHAEMHYGTTPEAPATSEVPPGSPRSGDAPAP